MARKPSRGRQRIKLEKMKNESRLQVTFSKRRSSVMKKSNELITRTGAQMAVIVFSPANKVFSFGNPSVEAILNRFQNLQIPNDPPPLNSNISFTEMLNRIHQESALKALFDKVDRLKEELEVERKYKQIMDQIEADTNIENLNMEELEKMQDTYQKLSQIHNKAVERHNHFQNVSEQPRDVNTENATRDMPTIGNSYVVSENAFGFLSQVFEVGGPSAFGVGGFHGEPSNSISYGVPVVAPTIGMSAETSPCGGFGFPSFPSGGASSSNNIGAQRIVPLLEVAPPSVDRSVVPTDVEDDQNE